MQRVGGAGQAPVRWLRGEGVGSGTRTMSRHSIGGHLVFPISGPPPWAPRNSDERQITIKVSRRTRDFKELKAAAEELARGRVGFIDDGNYGLQVKARCWRALRGKLHDERAVRLDDRRVRDFVKGRPVRARIELRTGRTGSVYAEVVALRLASEETMHVKVAPPPKPRPAKYSHIKVRSAPRPPRRDPEEITEEDVLDRMWADAYKDRIEWLGEDGKPHRVD